MFRFPPLTPLVKKLLIIVFGAYVAQLILENWLGVRVFNVLALHPGGLGLDTVWQLLTFTIAWRTGPAHVMGILISLLFFWWMLAPFEMRFGAQRTLQLCAVSSLAASVPAVIFGTVFPTAQPLYGTQPILLASISAFAWSYRGQGPVSFFGLFQMKPIHLIYLVLGLRVLMFLSSRDVVALIADLGAIGAGIGFIEWLRKPPTRTKRKRQTSQRFRVVRGDGDSERPKWLN